MNPIKMDHILFATDLSPISQHAFAYALSLAKAYGARLTLLHVIEEHPKLDAKIIGYVSEGQLETMKQQHENDARSVLVGKLSGSAMGKILDQLEQDALQALKTSHAQSDDIVVERGDPVKRILGYVGEKQCDLIVMGTHGQGTFTEALMGSTARRVLRRSPVPVLVVRLPEAP